MDNEEPVINEHEYDMRNSVPVEHRFDFIRGNQLLCTLHGNCVSLTIKPTEVLEPDERGVLHLVDKAP